MRKNVFINRLSFGVIMATGTMLWGQTHTFETADGYQLGSLNGQLGWSGGGEVISLEDAYAGTQALSVGSAGAAALFADLPQDGILYADFWVKTALAPSDEVRPLAEFGGIKLGIGQGDASQWSFYAQTEAGWLVIEDGLLPLNADGQMLWTRVTLWADFSVSPPMWYFCLNGQPVFSESLPSGATPPLGLAILGSPSEMLIDDVSVGDLGGLLLSESGAGNLNGGAGSSDYANTLVKMAPSAAAKGKAGITASSESGEALEASPLGGNLNAHCYVNPNVGDDLYDGLSPVMDGVHGPKATLTAGIAAVSEGGTVFLSGGIHATGEALAMGEKNITLRLLTSEATLAKPSNGGGL